MVMVAVSFPPLLPKLSAAPPLALLRPYSPISRLLVPVHSPPSPSLLSLSTLGTSRFRRFSVQDNGAGASETHEEPPKDASQEGSTTEEMKEEAATASTAYVAEELKEMMEARRKESSSSSSDLLKGVLEEVREIEWPSFGKVMGTTGIVLAVIVGSSVALLTINAALAEFSDRAFAGRGVQDFF